MNNHLDISQQLGKLPPQAVEVEEVVLGAILLEADALSTATTLLTPDHFYKDAHRLIFQSALNLYAINEPIDTKTIRRQLKKDDALEAVGGPMYIVELLKQVNSAANIESHCRIIAEQYAKRALIKLCSEVQSKAYEDSSDVFELLSKTDSALSNITFGNASNMVNIADKVPTLVENVEKAFEARKNNEVIGHVTGIKSLDRATGGFMDTDLIIVAARPGMGKTAFIVSIIKEATQITGDKVGLLSLEMGWEQIGLRLLSAQTEIDQTRLRNGDVKDAEWSKIMSKSAGLANSNIIIDDSSGLDIVEVKSKARQMKKKHNISMLVIDYLQLIKDKSKNNREQEISSISGTLKAIAKDLKIPVIALSQLSRAVETRGGDKRPQLSDLRDSGSIEQDADMVIFLYRPEYYGIVEDEEGAPLKGKGLIHIAKYRNGVPSEVWVNYYGPTTTWKEPFMMEDNEQPEIPYSEGFPQVGKDFNIVLPK